MNPSIIALLNQWLGWLTNYVRELPSVSLNTTRRSVSIVVNLLLRPATQPVLLRSSSSLTVTGKRALTAVTMQSMLQLLLSQHLMLLRHSLFEATFGVVLI